MSTRTRLARLENFQQQGSGAWIAREVAGKDEYLVSDFGGDGERLMTLAEIETDLPGSVVIVPAKCATAEEWSATVQEYLEIQPEAEKQ